MDFLALLVLFVLLVAIVAPTAGGFVAYFRGEWRMIRARTWAPGTADDPDVKAMVVRQRAMGKRLRRQGRSLLGPEGKRKAYTPQLTKPAPESTPPRANEVVVPLRRIA
jgi:hypothetical protein